MNRKKLIVTDLFGRVSVYRLKEGQSLDTFQLYRLTCPNTKAILNFDGGRVILHGKYISKIEYVDETQWDYGEDEVA